MKNNHPSLIRLSTAGLFTAVALVLGGCATNVNTVERADSRATPNYIADKRVITDNTLANTVRVVAVNQTTVSGNLLKIQATIENLRSSLRTINYKFEWVDQDGMMVGTPNETWKSIMLQGRETNVITTVAVNPRAVDFVLKLRE